MPEGLPIPGDTVRQSWGAGVRAGMYPISDTELYWFTVFNAPEVPLLKCIANQWVARAQAFAYGCDPCFEIMSCTGAYFLTDSSVMLECVSVN